MITGDCAGSLTLTMQETIINDFISPAVMFATLLFVGGISYPADKIVAASAYAQSVKTENPLLLSLQRFDQLQSYQVMLRSSSPRGERKVIRYSYRKPGYVRMDFREPHPGAVLIYNPVSGKVKLWPFGPGSIPQLNLLPTDSLIRDDHGHQVDHSDIGVLLRNIRQLQLNGTTNNVGEEVLSGQSTLHLSVTGPEGATVDDVHRYDVWLDNAHQLPVKVISYDINGNLLETVFMDAMVINVHFPSDFFTP